MKAEDIISEKKIFNFITGVAVEYHQSQLQTLKETLEIILDDAETMIIQEKSKGEVCECLLNELEDILTNLAE